jgi:signal transduction histidine kinase
MSIVLYGHFHYDSNSHKDSVWNDDYSDYTYRGTIPMPSKLFYHLIALLLFLSALVLPVSVLAAESSHTGPMLTVVDGVADLRDVNEAAGNQIIPLYGQWGFYWKQLLEPESLAGMPMTSSRLAVPSSWNNADEFADEQNQGYGYGTYRLLMRVPEQDINQNKALFLRSIGSAYRIWIDGREQEGLGTVGMSLEQERPQSHIQMLFFQPRYETFEIVIQVSNFSFREGGIMGEIAYGDTGALIPYVLKELLTEIGMIGGFLFVGLYHLIVFGMRRSRSEASTLLVGLLSLSVALRSLFISGYLSSLLAGLDDWEQLVKLEYTAELAAFVCGIYLIKHLYPLEVHRFMLRLGIALAGGMQLFVLLTPARIFTETMLLQTMLKAAVLLYFIVYVGVKAYIRRREGAFIHMLALVVIMLALFNDMLYYLRAIQTVELFGYSIVFFIMAQAILVSYRYTRLSRRNDMLVEELEKTNASLEEKVAERTHSLHAAQELRTKMLVNIAHDLGTPIVGIQTYIHLLVEGRAQIDRGVMTQQLLDKTAYVKRLIHDLFELSKLESKELVLHFDTVTAQSWLEEMYELFASDLRQKGFVLKAQWEEGGGGGMIRIDRMRMLQVLNNYMDNAMKFSGDVSKEIMLKGYVEQGTDRIIAPCLVIEVVDQGIGIAEAEQAQVFQRFYKRRERNEEGSGLGLAIVKEIVEQHDGEAGVRSHKGEGSIFFIKLPLLMPQE